MRLADIVLFHLGVIVVTLLKHLRKPKIKSILSAVFLAMPVIIYIIASDNVIGTVKPQMQAPILVIDAGHGGIDSGALAADGSKESDINLAIALKLRALAELYGLENSMIRQDDSTLSDADNYSEHRDLVRRTELVNSDPNNVCVSIHQNCYPTGQPHGSLVIYSSKQESEELGKIVHENLIMQLNPDNRRIAEPAGDKYYLLSNAQCPAILVECGFMSNFSEMEKLKTPTYQSSISSVLIASFLQYIQNTRYI